VLGHLGFTEQWTTWRGDRWRLVPDNDITVAYVEQAAGPLFAEEADFSSGTLQEIGTTLSFRLEKEPRKKLLRPRAPIAQIFVKLEDWKGSKFRIDSVHPGAARYLADSDALLYFFDPTYDRRDPSDPLSKYKSFDYFDAIALELRRVAAMRRSIYEGCLPQHIAVCVPKLDEQRVFDTARRYGCLEFDPERSADGPRPWVPPRYARRFFEALTYDLAAEMGTPAPDYLREQVGRIFHPERISYHALSSIGFYSRGGQLNFNDVCNREDRQEGPRSANKAAEDGSPPPSQVRGPINPVHALDPLITLVERATAARPGGRR
jgi:hypothetical protein